jgi:hypothetical protein
MARVEQFATVKVLELMSPAGYKDITVAKDNGTMTRSPDGKAIGGLPAPRSRLAKKSVQRK